MSDPNDNLQLTAKLNGEVIAEHTCRPAPEPETSEWAQCFREFIEKVEEALSQRAMRALGIDPPIPEPKGTPNEGIASFLLVALLLFLAVASTAVSILATGCTSTGAPNWTTIDREIETSASDLDEAAEWHAKNGEAGKAKNLAELADVLAAVDEAIDVFAAGGGNGLEARAAVEAAIETLGKYASETTDSKTYQLAAGAKSVLKRVLYYLPEKPEAPSPEGPVQP